MNRELVLELLRKNNPNLAIDSVNDSAFRRYGSVLDIPYLEKLIELAERPEMPKDGTRYEPQVLSFTANSAAAWTRREVFGETAIQAGLCWGYNNRMNGLEFHKSSEINIAVTDMVLLVGLLPDFYGDRYDSANLRGFYLRKGEAVELYATTLHYCPCQVSASGFRMVVILPHGTNTPLEDTAENQLLFRKNKWLMCHFANETLLARGAKPFIYGENIEVTGV